MNKEAEAAETPWEELRQHALDHYEEVSDASHHWASVVPRAINYYFDHCKPAEAAQMKCAELPALEHDSPQDLMVRIVMECLKDSTARQWTARLLATPAEADAREAEAAPATTQPAELSVEDAPIMLPDDIDPECVPLCNAMNQYRGITTIESCCGHNDRIFYISFLADGLSTEFGLLLYCFDVCHSGIPGWRIIARTDCSAWPVRFLVEGPIGDYAGANRIAEVLDQQRKEKHG